MDGLLVAVLLRILVHIWIRSCGCEVQFSAFFLQRLAIQALLKGSSVVVSAPTSSGKTLIAEAAAVATIARGRRLFYTTPLKALSNQKFRDFR